MKLFIAPLFLAAMFSFAAHAETEVPGDTNFGERDARGAYQEAQVKPMKVSLDYFPAHLQEIYRNQAEQYSGPVVQIHLQDGELKSENPENKHYAPLDLNKAFVTLYAVMISES